MAAPEDSITYGEGFSSGFLRFRESQEFADVTVTTAAGDWRLHSLLLASRSEFFYRALAGHFTESQSKQVQLHLDKCEEVWPRLVDFFYTDAITISQDNVLALLALARQLLVHSVENYCLEFMARHLSASNCVRFLREVVKHNIADIQQQCVALAAQGFHFLFNADFSGLPAATVLEVLRHPELLAHCEQQVLRFVMRYLSTTVVEAADVAAIAAEVRFQFLDNALLASLRSSPMLPPELLLAGALNRLATMDNDSPGGLTGSPPRPTYCCDARYGLPGGSTTLTVALEAIWQHVAPLCTVRVSGVSEGAPGNVLSPDPDAFFETDESADPLPFICVSLPANVRVVHFERYCFAHGHRRSGYYRLRNWATLTAATPEGRFEKIMARPSVNEQFEVNVAKQDQAKAFRSIKLVGTDRQEDSVFRLCVRNLRLFGLAEVDLMQQGGEQALELTSGLVHKLQAAAVGSRAGSPAPPGGQAHGGPPRRSADDAAPAAVGGDGGEAVAAVVPRHAVLGVLGHHPAAVGGGVLG